MIGNRCRAGDYCCEDISLIENYNEAMNSKDKYDCHHRLETHDENGKLREHFLSVNDLVNLGKYYNRPATELVFLSTKEHRLLHKKGKHISEEQKKRISETLKGHLVSDESRKKMSESYKGTKGMHWKLVDGKRVYYLDKKEAHDNVAEEKRA